MPADFLQKLLLRFADSSLARIRAINIQICWKICLSCPSHMNADLLLNAHKSAIEHYAGVFLAGDSFKNSSMLDKIGKLNVTLSPVREQSEQLRA